ncbi:MAG: hypothetical protein C1O27_001516 [Chloroflexi bacterium]|jgi:hypothetical protein|nr:MAG: hypothetical protein C1O27_001516 [Chloroflexota bacterium]
MPYIQTVAESDATGLVKEIYEGARRHLAPGANANLGIMEIFSLRPELLKARLGFVRAVSFGGSGLGARNEELIATSVAGLLNCRY